jgi:hypothetical protein
MVAPIRKPGAEILVEEVGQAEVRQDAAAELLPVHDEGDLLFRMHVPRTAMQGCN